MRVVNTDVLPKVVLSVANQWRSLGVGVDQVTIPTQQQGDREYRATFPGFDISRGNSGVDGFRTFHSSELRVPETRYFGRNYNGYANPEADRLIERFYATIPWEERMEIGRQIVHQLTDQVVLLDLVYSPTVTLIENRLQHVSGTSRWNVQEWDMP